MKIIVTGGTGLVGAALVSHLVEKGHEIHVLTRSVLNTPPSSNVIYHEWDPKNSKAHHNPLEGMDAVVHLAGASISQRWTKKAKKEILESRVLGTRWLIQAMHSASNPPRVFIASSAMGIYRPSFLPVKETDPHYDGFLSRVCEQWEAASDDLLNSPVRRVILRFGIVLDRKGGMLGKLDRFMKGVAGFVGSGKQFVSWIHRDDLSAMIMHCIENEKISGVYNASAPGPVRFREFVQVLSKKRGMWMVPVGIPSFLLQLILGEMSSSLLDSHRMDVGKIESTGFRFKFPGIQKALSDLYSGTK